MLFVCGVLINLPVQVQYLTQAPTADYLASQETHWSKGCRPRCVLGKSNLRMIKKLRTYSVQGRGVCVSTCQLDSIDFGGVFAHNKGVLNA